MNEPWFDPSYGWLPGTLLGCLAGLVGGLAGWLAPQGRAKPLILGSFGLLLGASVVMLMAGAVGYVSGQPYEVWYGLGLAGSIGVLVLGLNAPQLLRFYRQAEARRLEAQDLGY
jgi:hypothetical protein